MINLFTFFDGSRRTAGKRRASRGRAQQRRLRVESLEVRQMLSVTLPTPGAQTALAGAPLNVALNGSDTADDAVTYTISVNSSGLSNSTVSSPQLTATMMPQSNPTMTIAVTGTDSTGAFSGNMVFSLFSNYVPSAVSPITALVNNGSYNSETFFRVIENFMAQTGSPTNNGQGGNGTSSFDDDYNSNLRFTGPGILALANSGPDTNNSQFFITSPEETAPYTSGDFRYTIIGYLVSGSTILSDIMQVPVTTNSTTGFPDPNNPVTMTSVTMGTDSQDGVLQLSAPAGTTGSAVVTVTATSAADGGATSTTTFTVNVGAENYTDPPYIDRPVSPITTTVGAPVNFTIPATDVNGNAITYAATPANSTMTATAVNSTGEWTLNPSTLAAGVYSVTESATAASPASSENTAADTEQVPVYVDPAAPAGITLVPGSGATSTTVTDLNNSSGKTLEFDVTGLTGTATTPVTVDVYSDGTLIGSASATGTSVDVTTNGTVTLTAGAHSITATQTLENQAVDVGNESTTTNLASPNSTAFSMTVDTTPPSFTSTPVTSATVNVAYSYTATTATDSAGAETYSLISPVSGMSINSSTGLVQWTPSSGQGPTVSVDIQAADPAGNTAQQTFTIDVTTPIQAPLLTVASPSLGTIHLNTPVVAALTSFINNGSGTTTITDSGVAVGGIAVTAVSGAGTWQYSLDGKTFQAISPSGSPVSTTFALLLPQTAQIEYIPNGSTAETATISYYAWNTTSGTAGGHANVTTNGGTTAFSTASDTASLTVADITDSVVLTAIHPLLGGTTKAAAITINLSAFINDGSGTTTITPTSGAGIAVTGITGLGTWSYATSSGGAFTTLSSPSLSAPLLLGSGSELQYTPAGSDSEAPTITYYGWNGTGGTSGQTGANLSASGATGGTTAYSLESDTASLTVNDAPVLTAASPALGSTTSSTAKTISLTSTFINNGTGTTSISDTDANAVLGGIALTGTTGAGTWAYELSGSTTFTNVGTVSTTAALLLPATATLRYTPDGQSETATLTYCAWDQTSGTAGSTASTTTNGGTTAFSTTSDTASLVVNTAPVLTPASTSPSLGSTRANVAKTISLTGTFINNGSGTTTITDADSNAKLGGIALTGTTGKGTWAYELSGQTTFTNVGTVAANEALLLPANAILQYTPDGADAESPTITYRAWDQTTGVAGTTADSTADGGTTAFSTATDTATLTVTATNIAPELTAASPSLGQTALTTAKIITVASFINNGSGTTTITDSEPNAVIGGIALTGLTGDGAWSYELSGQTSFSPVAGISTSSALLLPKTASLRYTPVGTAESATITYCAWDTTSGVAGSTVDTTTNGGSSAFSSATDIATLTVGAYASLSGYVYIDPANNGTWTVSSKGLAGVTIRLLLENSSGTFTEVAGASPIQTSADGSYSFSSLAAGTYQIQESPPSKNEFVGGQSTLGSLSGTNPETNVFQITVTSGENGSGYNFAVRGVAPQVVSLRMFLSSSGSMTGVGLMQSLETAPSVNLAGASGSTATTGYSTTLSTHGSSVAIASPAASISSPDSSSLVSMTVTLTNPKDGSDELLQATTTGTPITQSYAGGVLSLSGVADTSTYQNVLDGITYSDTAASPTGGDRTIDVMVDDGILDSATAVSTVDVVPIGAGTTTTAVTTSASTIVYGQSVTLTATVSPPSGSTTPTGTVTFTSGSTTLGTGTLNSSGVATLSTTALAAGSDTVTASYGGDSAYNTSSGTVPETVSQAATTTALADSPNPTVYGQSVTLSATVDATSPGSGTPAGTVTFTEGSTTLGTGTLNSSGVATLSTTTLAVGSNSITASYGGNTDFTSSTSSAQTQTVSQAASTTAVAISPSSAVSGQSLTVTATVSAGAPGSGTPTGTVTFASGGTSLGTGTLNSSGVATLTTSALNEGSQTVTASYGGDTNFTASSGTGSETLGQAATSTALALSSSSAVSGQPLTFTATVSATSPGSGTPGGTVTFLDGTTTLGTGTLNSSGVATYTTSALSLGSHSITASYASNTDFAASTSSASSETVSQDATTTALGDSVSPAVSGEPVTFTATVSANSPGSGTPGGTVTFLDGTTTLGTGTLNSSGVATYTTSLLSVGTHSITASYASTTNFAASTSSAVSEIIQTPGTTTSTTALTASANPVLLNQSVTLTATVSPSTATGTVTFENGSTVLGTGTLTNGVATLSTAALTAGSDALTASYSGDATYAASSGTLTETVQTSGTTTTLGVSPSSSVYGQSVTLTADVAEDTSVSGTLSGTVTFSSGGTPLGTGTLSGGVATLTTSALPVGTDTITASYAGNSTFAGSTSSGASETVAKAATSTVIAASANPAVTGQYVTFTATVDPSSPGSGTPTGTVTFLDGGASLGTGTLNASGEATFTTTSLTEGVHTITADYPGDGNFTTSTSTALTENVNAVGTAATSTSVTAAPSPATAGQSVTFTATVTTSSGTPSGTVTFLNGATSLGSGTLSGGVATFSTSSLNVGSYTITASYSGDSNYAGSSNTVPETIGAGATGTTLGASVNPAPLGQSVTFTAIVSPTTGSGLPTGTVTFSDSSGTLGSGTLTDTSAIIGGVQTTQAEATYTTSTLPVGGDAITASYGGDSNYTASTGTLTETVQQIGTTTTLGAAPNSAVYGQSVTLTATVAEDTSGFGSLSGTVTFSSGGTTLGTGTVGSNGVATLSTTALPVGTDTITASYGGSTNFAGSTSTGVSETVAKDATATAVGISPTSAVSGQSLTVTATVSAASPGSGTPSGTVTFTSGGKTLGTESLSGGVATLTTNALTEGSQTVTASYSGDTNFSTGSGTGTETLGQAATAATLASSASSLFTGQYVTFTATVAASSPGSGTPTGTVTFEDAGTSIGTGTLNSSGVATFSTTALAVGAHTITAVYSADTNFTTSSSTALTETVSAVGTTVSSTILVPPDPNPASVGQLLTFTVIVQNNTSSSATPSGTVTFLDGTTVLGMGTLDDNGMATFSTSALSVGTHAIYADYSGDATFAASSDNSSEEIDAVGTTTSTTAVTASPSPANAGQLVTFTATVSPAAATGTVTFTGAGISPDTEFVTDGVATFSTSALPVGSDTITATYNGDSTYAASSHPISETINAVGTTADNTTVTALPSPATVGQSVTFTAQVTGSGTPTGTVTFLEGTTVLGTAALNGSGQATFSTSTLSVGTDTITALYSGDTTFAASDANAVETINSPSGSPNSAAVDAALAGDTNWLQS